MFYYFFFFIPSIIFNKGISTFYLFKDDKSCEDFPIEKIIFLANETARELARSHIFSFAINTYKLRLLWL